MLSVIIIRILKVLRVTVFGLFLLWIMSSIFCYADKLMSCLVVLISLNFKGWC